MVQKRIEEFVQWDLGGIRTDLELIEFAKANGGPGTRALVSCIEEGLEFKARRRGKRSKIRIEPNNGHLLRVLWWRYNNEMIDK